jgi:hypothetical protein
MLNSITYYPIYGKPFILYLGIVTLISFIITASIGISIHEGLRNIKFKWHPALAGISLTLALIHGTLGILAYF